MCLKRSQRKLRLFSQHACTRILTGCKRLNPLFQMKLNLEPNIRGCSADTECKAMYMQLLKFMKKYFHYVKK